MSCAAARIAIVHSDKPASEVLSKALASRFDADVVTFSNCENLLASSMDYDVFVVYNNFGKKMTGMCGVRECKPQAFIVGVTGMPSIVRQFVKARADAALLRAGNEVAELVKVIQKRPTGERTHNKGVL
jgi:hypothetical protein